MESRGIHVLTGSLNDTTADNKQNHNAQMYNIVCFKYGTVKPPIGNTPMAEHTADTEQFPWSQHASLTYRRFQLRNNF